jgi:hypothetical protein
MVDSGEDGVVEPHAVEQPKRGYIRSLVHRIKGSLQQ